MKTMLVIALTAVLVGYASADWITSRFGLIHYTDNFENCIDKKALSHLEKFPPMVLKSQITVNKSNDGQKFYAKDFTQVPTVHWSDADPDTKYTFLSFNFLPRLFWGVSNIPGTVLRGDGNITDYTQLNDYQPPNGDTTKIFYTALIYRQTKTIDPESARRSLIEASRLYSRKSKVCDQMDKRGVKKFYYWKFARFEGLCGPEAAVETTFLV